MRINRLKQEVHYSDLSDDFETSWNRDISLVTEIRAVTQSLIHITTTEKGSMPFDKDFGVSLIATLFTNITPLLVNSAVTELESTIKKYEPRVDRLQVQIIPDFENKNSIMLEIQFSIHKNPEALNTVSFELNK